MTLVLLYGPPAVGKLTVATALCELTGFRNFHNHLSFDLVQSVFRFPSPQFLDLLATIRVATFEAAARAGVPGMVFTLVYARPDDDDFVRMTIEAVERLGGRVAPVRIFCDADEQERRVAAEDRRRFLKLASVARLRELMSHGTLGAPIPFRASLDIDTTTMPPSAAARRIVAHYALPVG